jgi:hypothetical protein
MQFALTTLMSTWSHLDFARLCIAQVRWPPAYERFSNKDRALLESRDLRFAACLVE